MLAETLGKVSKIPPGMQFFCALALAWRHSHILDWLPAMPRHTHTQVVVSSTQHDIRVPRARIERLIALAGKMENTAIGQVDVAVVSADEMASHNAEFLGHMGPTDVLSFDMSDQTTRGINGQIIVCGAVAVEQGPLHGQSPTQELLLYVLHGLLHLMGYDDHGIRSAARMHARQDEILAQFRKTMRK